MNVFNYFIEANLGLAFVAIVYYLLLRNETQFSFIRAFLLIGTAASLLLPLLHLNFNSNPLPTISNALPAFFLPELVVGSKVDVPSVIQPSGVSLLTLTSAIYWIITSIFFVMLVSKIIRLIRWINSSQAVLHNQYLLIESDANLSSFSFFNYIFIGNASQFSPEEKQQIIDHELAHVKNFHSIDILFMEVIQTFFWFNPAIHFIKTSIKNIHEYQADQYAVQSAQSTAYCHLMARMALLSVSFSFANHFNQSQILKRITMINTPKTNILKLKRSIIAMFMLSLFVIIACQDQLLDDAIDMTQNSSLVLGMPKEVSDKLDILKQRNPKSEFVVLEMNEEGKKIFASLEQRLKNEKKYISTVVMNIPEKNGRRSFLILEYTDEASRLAELSSTDEVFTIVENPASPVFGMDSFFEGVSQTLKYPENARIKGIEGRVFIEFIVNKDGSLSDYKVVKGIDEECDAEAVRAVMLSQRWYPAKYHDKIIRQRLVLPITFKLGV